LAARRRPDGGDVTGGVTTFGLLRVGGATYRRYHRGMALKKKRSASDDGNENVFIGQGPFPRGNGNVVIRPNGLSGNIRIGGGVAIGHGAQADETSVAIGSGAGAGRRWAMVRQRWWDSSLVVQLAVGTLAAILASALLALLHALLNLA